MGKCHHDLTRIVLIEALANTATASQPKLHPQQQAPTFKIREVTAA